MSPRIHPDVDPPDPAVRAAEKALNEALQDRLLTHEEMVCIVVEAARPIWAGQLAIAIEDTAQLEPGAWLQWPAVVEFIRAREERP